MGTGKGRKESGEKWIQHYCSSHKILLVGEGDFSFSASLAKAFGSATNMVATSHDSKGPSSHSSIFALRHQKLLSGFFQSAREMLTDIGEVHVSHRNDDPYNRWKLEKLAKRVGLVLEERVEFRKSDYPGYHNKRGGGIKSNQKFPLNESFTFKFSLRDCSTMQQSRTSTSGCDDISEALAYLKLELMAYNDSVSLLIFYF
ncbi:heavy metal-associated isoprenylated plant protein 41-like [Magnolia sinica]|uniref:heavy metal-associated isoprenylated plant protein 41-like n=1 Tax=Magnolia sinica TaxID=86752 RepID=UPI002658ACA5|nr:heavy metal-associated isoprenylated plant protein 41-like [Magnolia sinica]